jgi:hypothetical protein
MKIFKPALVLLTMVAFAACDTAGDADDAPADSAAFGDTSAADSLGNMPTGPEVTNLDDVNDSGIEGEATATHSQQEVTVSILLKGDNAKADQNYPAHIHTGTCKDGGPVAVELAPVQNLQSSKTVSLSSLPANQPAFVQVHGADGKPVACGDMKGHDGNNRMGNDTTRSTTAY